MVGHVVVGRNHHIESDIIRWTAVRDTLKSIARGLALLAVLPALASFRIRAALMGANRALEGSTQTLALIPGVLGQYLRRAFLAQTIAACHPTAVISFGTLFSQTGARIEDGVYVGAGCHLGLVHIEHDALLGSGVHVTSGRHTHGTGQTDPSTREQEGRRTLVRIGASVWVGNAAVIMADVGPNSIIGAGAVVTKPIPASVVAVGVPARVIRHREPAEAASRESPLST
jgi:virginiamycin A acetyltransferase